MIICPVGMPSVIERWPHPTIKDAPLALVIHGTGSNPDFIRRTFGKATHARGYSLASYRLRGHGPGANLAPGSFDQHLEDLASVVASLTPEVLGGVSLGAHLSAALSSSVSAFVSGLVLAFPAWTGAPDDVAAANATQADAIARQGVAGCLEELDSALAGSAVHWVYDEMYATWTEHDPSYFERILRETAISAAPTLEQLGAITVPAGVASSIDDPLHPLRVGETWAAAIPRGVLRTLKMSELGADRGVIGETAWSALEFARQC